MVASSLWVLVSAVLVFMMQAGFLCLEVGMVRERDAEVVALKNFVDWVLANLIFAFVGFGLMFGESFAGIVGTDLFALEGLSESVAPVASPEIFFLFQLAFAGTTATIVSGALAGRASFAAYVGATIVMVLLVYPVMGHWAWGGALVTTNTPWLSSLGFRDFAGSTVVHSTGAWFALVAAWRMGPRLGRFDASGVAQPIRNGSIQLSTLGALILWIGWWGFNGGSTLAFDASVGKIILSTNLAGAAGALVAIVHGWLRQEARDLGPKLIGGALGGLVAITASCDVASPLAALLIGAVAGWIHNVSFEWLSDTLKIDDPVGVFAVHGACGIWGTLAVALALPADMLEMSRIHHFGVQLVGTLACAVWASGTAFASLYLIERTIGLRISPDLEREGVDITGRSRPVEMEEQSIDLERLRALMGGDQA